MKKLILLLVALLPLAVVEAETFSKKEQKQIEKRAKGQAKMYEAEGWKTLPGALPLLTQLEETNKMQLTKDDEGEYMFIVESGEAVAGSYNVAKLQAVDAAKFAIAGAIETKIGGLIESGANTQQLTKTDAASLSKMESEWKSMIANELGRVKTVVEMYQDVNSQNVRVSVQLAYSIRQAQTVAKKVIYKQLEDDSKGLKEKLDQMLGW